MIFTRIPPSLHTPPRPAPAPRPRWGVLACALGFVVVLAGANVLTSRVGLVPAGFGLAVTAGTYTAGLALALRDTLQDLAGSRVVLATLAVAAACSALTADPRIALASTVAAVVSELADFAVYTALRHRHRILAVAASGLIGALVDSVGFLALAGFPVTTTAIAGQLLVKVVWVIPGYLLLGEGVRRVVSWQRQHPRHPRRHARR
jgi:uncharacterized PurR-regulated membrane protein YhhQ (DUF165 family)